MTVSYRDGQYFREESTQSQIEDRAKVFSERRRNIEQYCEIVPVDVPDDATELARGLIAQSDSNHILDAALLAADSDCLLISDDLYFRQIAQQACNAKGVFLQAAFTVAGKKGLLTDAEISKAIVGIASLRHSHVALTPAILLYVAKDDETDRQMKFRAVTEFIGTKAAEIFSHVRITALFLEQVWALDIPDLRKMVCSGIILEQLLRFRQADYGNILAIFRSNLSGRASNYLDDWIRGHFVVLDRQ